MTGMVAAASPRRNHVPALGIRTQPTHICKGVCILDHDLVVGVCHRGGHGRPSPACRPLLQATLEETTGGGTGGGARGCGAASGAVVASTMIMLPRCGFTLPSSAQGSPLGIPLTTRGLPNGIPSVSYGLPAAPYQLGGRLLQRHRLHGRRFRVPSVLYSGKRPGRGPQALPTMLRKAR